jgi:hypothetical protein
MREVTFGDFSKLANKRRLTPEYLTERFTDKIERPSEFFHRVFQGQHARVVIPYRSVLAFYVSELDCHQDRDKDQGQAAEREYLKCLPRYGMC